MEGRGRVWFQCFFFFSFLSGTRPSQGHRSRVAAKVLWAWALPTRFWWNFYCVLSSSSTWEWIFSETVETTTFFLSIFWSRKATLPCVATNRSQQNQNKNKKNKKAVLSWDLGSFFLKLCQSWIEGWRWTRNSDSLNFVSAGRTDRIHTSGAPMLFCLESFKVVLGRWQMMGDILKFK